MGKNDDVRHLGGVHLRRDAEGNGVGVRGKAVRIAVQLREVRPGAGKQCAGKPSPPSLVPEVTPELRLRDVAESVEHFEPHHMVQREKVEEFPDAIRRIDR